MGIVLVFVLFCFCVVFGLTGISAMMLSLHTGQDERRKRSWTEPVGGLPLSTFRSLLDAPKQWPMKQLLALAHPTHGPGFVYEHNRARVFLGQWDNGQKPSQWIDYPSTGDVLADGWSDV